ncbi:hypothetical protein [Halobellus rubicundus]|uniref:Uncharacterized protein n=1 Tax=Halobellus rubicundus TaxID=2996466 RepID=A0ABD5MDY9_9EURY
MTVERIPIGGKTGDGDPVHLSPWTFEVPQIRELVERWLAGEVLNACAGKTKLDHDGPVLRNDIDRDRDVDTHHDVRELDEHFDHGRFDTVVYDPPYTKEMAERHYDGNHVGHPWEPRGAIANVTAPGGHVLTFGYNSDGLDGWEGWERVATYYFRTPNWSGNDIALSVDRKGGSAPVAGEVPELTEQATLVQPDGGRNSQPENTGIERSAGGDGR